MEEFAESLKPLTKSNIKAMAIAIIAISIISFAYVYFKTISSIKTEAGVEPRSTS